MQGLPAMYNFTITGDLAIKRYKDGSHYLHIGKSVCPQILYHVNETKAMILVTLEIGPPVYGQITRFLEMLFHWEHFLTDKENP